MQAYLIFAANDKQMKEKDSTCDRLTDFRPWRSCTTQGEQARSNAGRFLEGLQYTKRVRDWKNTKRKAGAHT